MNLFVTRHCVASIRHEACGLGAARKWRRGRTRSAGSAHDDVKLKLLKAAAWLRLAAERNKLDPNLGCERRPSAKGGG